MGTEDISKAVRFIDELREFNCELWGFLCELREYLDATYFANKYIAKFYTSYFSEKTITV